jgi:epoxyqueuosine reductase
MCSVSSRLTPDAIKSRAREIGFDLCGIARAERHPKLARLRDWIADGRAGEMAYLARTLDERSDPARVLPSARSIVSLAVCYNTGAPYSTTIPEADRACISRYAWGDDYHEVIRTRLRTLVAWMASMAGTGFEAFACVDTGPVQERVVAEQAGLGWIGKNTCVINARLGSWLFLAEILTNADLDAETPAVDQCGTCRRCLDACPTGAIVEPYMLDATRCLSYLTIETRGAIAPAFRPAIGRQIYGCDICQDVCPWNRRAATSDDPAWQPRASLGYPRLLDLCRLSDEAWRAQLKGSAMQRAGLRRLRRSLAYAAATQPRADRAQALDALSSHGSATDPVVQDAIAWARDRSDSDAGEPSKFEV